MRALFGKGKKSPRTRVRARDARGEKQFAQKAMSMRFPKSCAIIFMLTSRALRIVCILSVASLRALQR